MVGKHSGDVGDIYKDKFKKKRKNDDDRASITDGNRQSLIEQPLVRINYNKNNDEKNSLEHNLSDDKMDDDNIVPTSNPMNLTNIILQQQKEIQNLNSEIFTVKTELYKKSDKGPFKVILEGDDIDGFEIGLKLNRHGIKNIILIEKISRNKIRIQCKDAASANEIIKKSEFEDLKKYKTYIPNNFVTSIGLIRNVPTYLTESEIRNNIDSDTIITDISRMSYYNKEDKTLKPSKSLKITFRASTIPTYIIICHMKCNVEYFLEKPLWCTNCLSYGHFKKYCKAEKVCRICAVITHNEEITCKPYCKHCKDNNANSHKTADLVCPEYKLQCDIREVMTKKKVTFYEAKDYIKNNITLNKHNKNYNSGNTYAEIIKQASNKEAQKNEINIQKLIDTIETQKVFIDQIKQIMQITKSTGNVPYDNDSALMKITELLLLNNNVNNTNTKPKV